jgi:hypothetical protein
MLRFAAGVAIPPPEIVQGSFQAALYVWFDLQQASLGGDDDVLITSWWRTRGGNAAVGGHPESQHLIGSAVDLVGPSIASFSARLRWLHLVHEADHLHAQLWPAGGAADLVRVLAV